MRRLVLIVLVALSAVVVALVVSDRGGDGRRRAGPASTGGSSSASSSSTTTTTRPRRGSNQPVTIAFGGDTHFEGNLRYLLNSDPGGMFDPIAPTLSAADVAMVNLETAIATGGSPDPKNYNFRAPPSAFEALRAAGVDAVTMANNHGRDYGAAGFAETLAAKAQTPLAVLGIGANATEAYRPWLTTVKGQRLAFLAATDVLDDWLVTPWTATDSQPGLASTKGAALDRLLAGIRATRPQADTIVVYLHWGVEGSTCPTPRQQELAKALTGAGADIVVGSHSHRVETAGRLDGALVDYGLGNFAFYNESGPSGVTGVLRVTVTGRDIDSYEWLPARISGGIPHLMSGSAAASDDAAFASRRACAGLAP